MCNQLKEVQNSTKSRNAAVIGMEVLNAICLASLAFLIVPNLTLFEANILPYTTVAGPLLITLIFKSSLHPKGWKGFSLDLAGLILLLGAITLVGNGPQPDGNGN